MDMPPFVIEEEELMAFFNTFKKFLVEKLKFSEKQASQIYVDFHRKDYFMLSFKRGNDSFYLKIGNHAHTAYGQRSIVVAVIIFSKTHTGSGTKLIKELCKVGLEFNYEWFAIESPNSNCQEFMKKLGFKDTSPMRMNDLKESIQKYESQKKGQLSLFPLEL
jgi:hypothetical protein